jgi:2-desacetyl-2-hydroxyethyl bacteriochlorophyllide A dehydrogenase
VLPSETLGSEGPARETPVVVRFTGPRQVDVVPYEPDHLAPGHARVRTHYSGISAGTEMTAYRGSNPYLNKKWDAGLRLFTPGEKTFSYPVAGWGYSEVGEVVAIGEPPVQEGSPDTLDACVPDLDVHVGDIVYGIWGHRSEAVLPVAALAGHRLAPDADSITGVFARVGAIALNAVLAADVHLGETVAVFGQGVIGLLATRLAVLSGATVVAVDTVAQRLDMAERFGASRVLDVSQGSVAERIRQGTHGQGADVAIELSGSYAGLHEAVRATAVGGRVVAAGFYQGSASGLDLGEEFHHNRISIVASQIGGVPGGLAGRWTSERLHAVVMQLIGDGRVDVASLVSSVVPVAEAASAYRMLDEGPAKALQVVLDFRGGVDRPGAL